MLTKADIKYINSLQNKKYRKLENAFFVEGLKNVQELIKSDYNILRVFCLAEVLPELFALAEKRNIQVEVIKLQELSGLGTLENNRTALAVAQIKDLPPLKLNTNEWAVATDGLNDPGNLGTIIRIADWYGIKKVLCSIDSVDIYNPKVINASKGSFTRVETYYLDLEKFFGENSDKQVVAACMHGETIYSFEPPQAAIILMGNEANGIRESMLHYVHHKLHIPRIGQAESLNVGVATGIIVDRLLGGK